MKIGDLVNFETKAWVFENAAKEYSNPGVIVASIEGEQGRDRHTVMWSNQSFTTEYECYLQVVKKKERFE